MTGEVELARNMRWRLTIKYKRGKRKNGKAKADKMTAKPYAKIIFKLRFNVIIDDYST